MLIISRKEGETITIEPIAGLDPALTLQEAFAQGLIAIKLVHVGASRVRLAIDAPVSMRIWRGHESSSLDRPSLDEVSNSADDDDARESTAFREAM